MGTRAFLPGAALFVLATSAVFSPAACSSEASQDPSFIRVELIPAITAATIPRAVQVVIKNAATDSAIASLCVNIEGTQGTPTASFILQRDAGKPATDRILVEVTPFDVIDGQGTVESGKEFACPAPLPSAVGDVRQIELDFCAGEARTLVFHVGAICCDGSGGAGGGAGMCTCAPGSVCGVGLASAGKVCGPGQCCDQSIPSACELDI
jgi:hypothetical protein